jgi:hypothetical protein
MNELDTEIQAIAKITEALSSLEPDAIQRVLDYVAQRYQSKMSSQVVSGPVSQQSVEQTFSEFHELYDAAQPVSGPDKALIAGYWFQHILGKTELDSFQLNKILKNLGYPLNNITRDLDTLMRKSPRLVTQLRKEGTSQQARKTYKLTLEGIRAVQRMLAANRSSETTNLNKGD